MNADTRFLRAAALDRLQRLRADDVSLDQLQPAIDEAAALEPSLAGVSINQLDAALAAAIAGAWRSLL